MTGRSHDEVIVPKNVNERPPANREPGRLRRPASGSRAASERERIRCTGDERGLGLADVAVWA